MKWFKHDSNANMDAKLQEVLLDYGLEGYGLYWYCIELITNKVDKDNITFSLEHDARIIARNTGSTAQKVTEIMKYFVKLKLFENTDGLITCFKLAKRLDKSMTSNPEMRKTIENLGKIKNKNHDELKNSHDFASNSHDGVMTSSEKPMQDQIRLDQIRLDNKNNTSIDVGNKKQIPPIPYKKIIDLFHEILTQLPSVAIVSNKRKNAIKKLWNHHDDHKSISWWKEYFEYVSESQFLTNPPESKSNPNWKADFEWITNFNNFVKIIEGKYHHAA